MLEAEILTKVGKARGEQRQVNQFAETGHRNVGRPGFGEECADPAEDGREGELHDCDQGDVDGLAVVGGGDDVQREEYPADQSQAVAPADGELARQADEADAENTQENGDDVGAVRADLFDGPGQERDKDAVGGGQEGVLGRRRAFQADCLKGVGQTEGRGDDEARL